MLSPSGSGRVSLMSFWARQVRGVLPIRIKPVVARGAGERRARVVRPGSVPEYGHWPGARRSSRSVSSTPTESCPLPPTTVVELDIDTSFENHRWHYGSAWTYAYAWPEVG
jgi:hypothetical protein